MRAVKVGAIVANLALAGAVLSAHSTSSLFPAIPLGVTIATIAFLPASYRHRHSPMGVGLALWSIITIAVVTRWFIFQYPASLIGFDPHRYALWTDAILRSGSTQAVEQGFYSQASLFLLLPAIVALLLDTTGALALGLYPVAFGILLPLLAVIFTRRMTSQPYSGVGIAAAAIAGVITVGISFSYWPVAQSLSSLILCISLFALYVNSGSRQAWRVIILLTLTAMTFTHKIPLALITGFLTLSLIIHWSQGRIVHLLERVDHPQRVIRGFLVTLGVIITAGWLAVSMLTSVLVFQAAGLALAIILIANFWTTPPRYKPFVHRFSTNEITAVIPISLALSLLQYTVLTAFLGTFILQYIDPFFREGLSVAGGGVTYQAASRIQPGVLDAFYHRHDMLLLMLLLGLIVVWLGLYASRDWSVPAAAVGGVLLLSPFALTVGGSIGVGAHRLILNVLPLIAAVVAIGFVWVPDRRHLKHAAALGLVVVVIFQGFGVGVVPDYPDANRDYLTSAEVEGKSFAHGHIDSEVHTDHYYAQESVLPVTSKTEETAQADFVGLNDGYLNRTILKSNPPHIAQRTNIEGYRFNVSGYWRLHWDPVQVFDSARSRVYSNGEVVFYAPDR